MRTKRRSRWLCLLLAVLLTLGLFAGCSNSNTGAMQENASALKTITESELQLIEIETDETEAEEIETGEADGKETAEAEAAETELAEVQLSIDEDGSYTTKEDVALYLHIYGKLPSNFITKKEAEKLGWTGGSLEPYAPGKCLGGNHFGNYEGLLPDGDYKECDIDTLGKKKRGAKRLIYSDDGRIYYTDDHYESFIQLY